MSKKILFYTDTPGYGGAEVQMTTLAKKLSAKNYEVHLACGSYGKFAQKNLGSIYKKIYKISAFHKHDPRHYFGLKKILKQNQFDLIHIHLWNPGACRYAFFAAKKMGVPIITTEHDPFLLRGWKAKIKQKCLKLTDQTIVVSTDNFRQLSKYGQRVKNRLNIVFNGIEVDQFLDKNTGQKRLSQKPKTILCVAELHPRKGHQYLIEAFQKIKPEFPGLILKIVGTGPAEKELKEKYSSIEGVEFMGWVPDIKGLYNESSLFVLPSSNEAFGLVLLEAMASGTLVIAANSGGPKDIIIDGKTGYLFEPKNSEDLAKKMQIVLLNPEEKFALEKAAIHRLKTHFTADLMAENTLEVYDKLLSN